jgi:ankyrin repeat protein
MKCTLKTRASIRASMEALVVTVCGGTDEDAEAQVRAFDGDVNAFDAEGNTLLYWAADNGKARTIAALAARGADPLLQTQAGVTVLDWAVYQDNGSMEALFDAFPDLDVNVARRSDGMTPLHQAAAYGLVASVRVLLGRGARMDIWNGENETAQDAAREMEQEETEELLARAVRATTMLVIVAAVTQWRCFIPLSSVQPSYRLPIITIRLSSAQSSRRLPVIVVIIVA